MRDMPKEYLCPISQEIMQEPVIAEDVYIYERVAIVRWLNNPINEGLSPLTKKALNKNNLIINRNIRSLIQAFNTIINQRIPVNDNKPTSLYQANSITHIDLLNNLITALGVDSKQVYWGSVVEQTMVALVGIYTSQKDSIFRRDNNTGNTNFMLNFTDSREYQKLLTYYHAHYANSILDGGTFINSRAILAFNTNVLNSLIVPALGEYKKNSHIRIMEQLSAKLNVPFEDVYTGSAVEQYLVGKAGIFNTQESAYFRQQEDYTTKFYLSFTNEAEYKKFIDYYEQNYPSFIIKRREYQEGSQTEVEVNPGILLNLPGQGLCNNL